MEKDLRLCQMLQENTSLWARYTKLGKMACERNFQIALIGVFIFTGDLQKLCFLFKHCQSVHYQVQKISHTNFSKSVCVLDLNTLLPELPEIDVQQGQSQQTSLHIVLS